MVVHRGWAGRVLGSAAVLRPYRGGRGLGTDSTCIGGARRPLGRGSCFLAGHQDVILCTWRSAWSMGAPLLSRSQRKLLGLTVDESSLGQKPKLGGVRISLPFHLYRLWFRFDLFELFACSSLFFLNFQKQQKDFSFLFVWLTFEKPKKISFLSLVCFVCRVQLASVVALALDYIFRCSIVRVTRQ